MLIMELIASFVLIKLKESRNSINITTICIWQHFPTFLGRPLLKDPDGPLQQLVIRIIFIRDSCPNITTILLLHSGMHAHWFINLINDKKSPQNTTLGIATLTKVTKSNMLRCQGALSLSNMLRHVKQHYSTHQCISKWQIRGFYFHS